MSLTLLAAAATADFFHYDALGLSPVALDLGFFQLRWYSLAYIAGILIGWWYLLKLIAQPGAPMTRHHADDMVFYATLGILIGGRLAYVFFYQPEILRNPIDILKLWQGGMSFHGGAIGVMIGILLLARKHGLNWLRVHDYVACCVPFGLFFGRLANFVNGELWGRETDVPWAMIFPDPNAGGVPRHPSQLYEAALEGIVLFAVLAFFFWRTKARYEPGKLVGIFLLGYGLSRFIVEFFREPDVQLGTLSWGLTMGQTLTLPMILGGLYLIGTAKGRRQRVEPIAGRDSVA
ncbi:prolipoprotein diacylglyceryl transferase [Sphingomonas oleivorans]|uniref:Phosphatidylglycerol--prolipoprotein diacylglyceryl transferase n=1 Tax=Sphingomonas oleivorans TaxID=1735121 RepID=A0A2T5G248_9SPHN|nr:prolipoprotein diacylglyceryl transferase [Sphingomonas oleivorans]PTQ13200.1 prolipoprotein diacylglyceryl transferase [Sphingomonas oleivorans]